VTHRHAGDETIEAVRGYAQLLGLPQDGFDDPALIAETAALTDALAAAAERDLGDAPLPLLFMPALDRE
jgi:hypothetical protein